MKSEIPVHMSFDADAFIQGLVTGRIRPTEVLHKTDEHGQPLTIYVFPEFKCAVHAHFKDADREIVAPSHIRPFSSSAKKVPIDNYTLAMLRHYAEESHTARVPRRRRRRLSLAVALVLASGVVFAAALPTIQKYRATLHARRTTLEMEVLQVTLTPSSVANSPTSLVIKPTLSLADEHVRNGLNSKRMAPHVASVSGAVADHLGRLHFTSAAIYPFEADPRTLLGYFSLSPNTSMLEREITTALDDLLSARGLPNGVVKRTVVEVISPPPPKIYARTRGAERSRVLHSRGRYYFMEPDDEWQVTGTYTFPSGRYGLGSTPTWFRVRGGEDRYIVDPARVRLTVKY